MAYFVPYACATVASVADGTQQVADEPGFSGLRRWKFWLLLIFLLIPSSFAVTGQSLWVDEATSVWFADHARGVNPAQFSGLAAVPEMPAFHIVLTGWVRVFGDSERAVRAMSLPFAALFLGSLLLLSGIRRFAWLAVVPFAFFPLLTYYVNEARPYAAILALSTAACVAFVLYLRTQSRALPWLCMFFLLATFIMHLLGILATLVLGIVALSLMQAGSQLRFQWKAWIPACVAATPVYAALLAYYQHVRNEGVHVGAKFINPDTPGNVTSSWKNILFFGYETFGFSGLGPPRNALRVNAGLHSFQGYAPGALLGLLAVAVLAVCFFRLRGESVDSSTAQRLMLGSIGGLLALFILARAVHFGFFGRHGMGLIGPLCCAMVLILSLKAPAARWRYAVTVLLALAWGTSTIRGLLVYPYAKDDARTALDVAKASGLPILWNADEWDAAYYGGYDPERLNRQVFASAPTLPTPHWLHTTPFLTLPNLPPSEASRLAGGLRPGHYILVQGKSDVDDSQGAWQEAMSSWQPHLLNQLNGFNVWAVTLPAHTP